MKTISLILALLIGLGAIAGDKNSMPQLLEGEYGIDTDNNDNNWSGNSDGDIDTKIKGRNANHPIEFSIDIPVNPDNQNATLVLDVYDVDVDCKSYSPKAKCEVDVVYVNGIKIGVLNGKDDEWSRNRLSIPENILKQGKNNIEIHVNTLKEYTEADWEMELNWAYITGLSTDPNKLSISKCWVAPQEVRPGDYVNFFAKVRGNPESVNVYNGDLKVLDITDPDGDGVYSGQFQAPTYWADSDNQNWKSSWAWQATKEGQESVCPGFKLRQDTTQVGKAEDTSAVISSWDSDWTIVTFKQDDNQVKGFYEHDKRKANIEGIMRGSSLEGFYFYPNETGSCQSRKFKNESETTKWGTFQWTFSDDSFKGNWNSCSKEIDPSKNEWTGTRIDY